MSQEQSKSSFFDFLGKEVDRKTEMFPGMGKYAKDVEKKFVEIFKARALSNITIKTSELGSGMLTDKKPYICLEQEIGKTAKATTAVNISMYGTQDLQIERRHFEQNTIVTGTRIVGKSALVYFSIPLIIVGLFTGFILTIVGGVMMYYGLKGKSDSDLFGDQQKKDSWLLAQAVDASLKEAVEFVKSTKM